MKLARAAARLNRETALPSLVFLTDDDRIADPLKVIASLPSKTLVILRARNKSRRESLAAEIPRIARSRGLDWLVADDPELALRSRACGAHFPESSAHRLSHWRTRRPDWLITAAAHSLRASMQARCAGADAVLLGPVFATESHVGRKALGVPRLRMLARMSPLPVYALGGINGDNVARLAGAKLAGLACVGALAS